MRQWSGFREHVFAHSPFVCRSFDSGESRSLEEAYECRRAGKWSLCPGYVYSMEHACTVRTVLSRAVSVDSRWWSGSWSMISGLNSQLLIRPGGPLLSFMYVCATFPDLHRSVGPRDHSMNCFSIRLSQVRDITLLSAPNIAPAANLLCRWLVCAL
jgi:hypothetical protein